MLPVGFEPTISTGAAVDLRLRPRGYWDRQKMSPRELKLLPEGLLNRWLSVGVFVCQGNIMFQYSDVFIVRQYF